MDFKQKSKALQLRTTVGVARECWARNRFYIFKYKVLHNKFYSFPHDWKQAFQKIPLGNRALHEKVMFLNIFIEFKLIQGIRLLLGFTY